MCFSKQPKLKPAVMPFEPPHPLDANAQLAAQQAGGAKRGGYGQTILTGARGLLAPAPTTRTIATGG